MRSENKASKARKKLKKQLLEGANYNRDASKPSGGHREKSQSWHLPFQGKVKEANTQTI